MIANNQLINRVKDQFGLNIYETKVWLSLLSKGVSSAGEIAEMSNVPRSRTYDVLESLEKRGFAVMKIGKPVKYIAVKPDVILEKLKINLKNQTDEKIKTLSKLKETNEYSELKELYDTGIAPIKHEELTGAIKGKNTIYSHLKELFLNAKKEIAICTDVVEMNSKLKFFTQLFQELEKHGIKVKIALYGDEKEIKKINTKLKINAKKIDFQGKFYIIDSEQVLFLISHEENHENEIAVWLNTPFLTSTLKFMFNQVVK